MRRALPLLLLLAAPAVAQERAEGQGEGDYRRWRNAGDRVARIAEFAAYLKRAHVDRVVPVFQLLRTASAWRECRGEPFAVPPRALWRNVAQTLRYVDRVVKPAVGRVEVVSGWRYPALNQCAHGAPASAHATFRALDLVPVGSTTRQQLIAVMCRAHGREGPRWRAGMGFYSGRRFHVDTAGFRRWGTNGRGATSPCAGRAR